MERLTEKITNKNTKEVLAYRVKCKKDITVIQKLGELEDLEEQGLLIRLPCKVGETIYILPTYENTFKEITEMIVNGFSIGEPNNVANCNKKGLSGLYQPSFECFEKTVFLTREEAEAKLEELKESDLK